MSAKIINKNNFDILVGEKGTVLLDFFAEWCGPCRMVLPIVDEIAGERADVAVGKVNVENENELASKFGVFSIPTLVVLKDGKEVRRAVGARRKDQILELIDG